MAEYFPTQESTIFIENFGLERNYPIDRSICICYLGRRIGYFFGLDLQVSRFVGCLQNKRKNKDQLCQQPMPS